MVGGFLDSFNPPLHCLLASVDSHFNSVAFFEAYALVPACWEGASVVGVIAYRIVRIMRVQLILPFLEVEDSDHYQSFLRFQYFDFETVNRLKRNGVFKNVLSPKVALLFYVLNFKIIHVELVYVCLLCEVEYLMRIFI